MSISKRMLFGPDIMIEQTLGSLACAVKDAAGTQGLRLAANKVWFIQAAARVAERRGSPSRV